ncbi:MAG: asparagine synthase (glutamine-hydrolyzing) [Alphaproteobacteria bacterium]
MCGIAGIMTQKGTKPDLSLIDRFKRDLRHRGPDGDGIHAAGNMAMLQTRLAIIDLETGDQPLIEPGGAALVANGEIYNYLELRQELSDVTFTTNSDCEPPLHLYRRRGENFASALRGMYAIAIHDPAKETLLLARDPFGIKPLYYVEGPDFFAFASEPRALINAGLAEADIVPERRDELLQLQFTCGRETIFRSINRVQPGETLIVRDARVVDRHRIAALTDEDKPAPTIGEALARLDAALENSVRLHQRSDVPYGLFLSGGVDSSVVLAMMARLNDRPVRTYTVGFSGTRVADERAHARAMADLVGAEHTEIEFGEEDFWTLLPRIVADMDDPAADYAILPSWKLARTASRDLKVVLSGEGGDELFAGYGRYRSLSRPWWMGGRNIRAKGTFDGLGVLRNGAATWRDGIAAAEITATQAGRTRLQVAQATDCADWLPNDLLTKLDRCLMAHGLEGRTPLLDPEIAAVAFNLPDDLKLRDGLGKWLLRRWLERALPQAKPFERKRGFTVPVGEWILKDGKRLGKLVGETPGIKEIAWPEAVARLFATNGKRAGFAAWTLLFYALWHRHHVEGVDPGGSVLDVLSAH